MQTELPDTTMIWHYMPFRNAKRTLSLDPCAKGVRRCALWFSRPSAFEDEMEGKCPEYNLKRMEEYAQTEFGDDGLKEIKVELKKQQLRQRCAVFVNCWHISDKESLKMWQRYGEAPEGVAIQSTVGDVRFCLDIHGDGKVEYYRCAEGFKSNSVFGTQDKFLKRTSYDWENEFRLEVKDDVQLERIEQNEDIQESELSPGIRIGISDVDRLINRLVVAPGASEAFMDQVRGLCAAVGMSWLARKLELSRLG
jgi:hypothetical protein